jgi:hypothetical protein
MRTILTLLAVATMLVTLPAAADGPASPTDPGTNQPSPTTSGPGVRPKNDQGLVSLHGDLTAQGARAAGRPRDVDLSAPTPGGPKPVRPPPTPRALRKMGADRAIAAVDPSVRACASESAVIAPTSFSLRVSVGPAGDVEAADSVSPPAVAPALLQCVVKAVSAAHFGAPGPTGASIVVPITVPGRTIQPTNAIAAAPPVAPAAMSGTSGTSVTLSPPSAAAGAAGAPVAETDRSKDAVANKQ